MSIATVVTRGYGIGSAAFVVTRGYSIGAPLVSPFVASTVEARASSRSLLAGTLRHRIVEGIAVTRIAEGRK